MSCPLPTEESWNPLNNGIDKNAFERICNEFRISVSDNFRQKLDPMNGLGYVWYTKITNQARGAYRSHYIITKKFKTKTDSFDSKFKVEGFPVDYLEQNFHKESGYADHSPDGSPMAALGSFVADSSDGFTRAGISRINDSIRVYSWAILGAQAQARSSILGGGRAFDAQKQFLANVEDSINSAVDLPGSIDRYQRTLQYAKSKLDFVIGHGLHMLPSNMDLHIGTVNGYNNLIQIATDDMEFGYNPRVNDEPVAPILSTTQIEDDFPQPEENDFSQIPDSTKYETPENDKVDLSEPSEAKPASEAIAVEKKEQQEIAVEIDGLVPLTHDEKKLSIILAAAAIGCAIVFFKK